MNRQAYAEDILIALNAVKRNLYSLSLAINDLKTPFNLRTTVEICMQQACATSIMRSSSAWYGVVTYVIDKSRESKIRQKIEERNRNIAEKFPAIFDEASFTAIDATNAAKHEQDKKDDCFSGIEERHIKRDSEWDRLKRLEEMRKLCKDASDRAAQMPPWKRNLLRDSGKSTLDKPRPPVDNGEDFY